MVMRSMRLVGVGFGLGAGIGVAVDRLMLELRKPAVEQFMGLRRRVNGTVNPFLLEHHVPGTGRTEIGTLEHVGRTSRVAHQTPVHPTLRGEVVYVPAPLGVGSQWARNVLAERRARLQLHDTLYELERPELVSVADTGFFPAAVAAPFDHMGWRYVRFHVAGSTPGALLPIEPAVTMPEPRLDGPYTIPVEPRMVEPRNPVAQPVG